MSRGTSIGELNTVLGAIITESTGRRWWKKGGLQVQPKGTYATIIVSEAGQLENPVIEVLPLDESGTDETLQEKNWGASELEVEVQFIRSATGDSAQNAALKFRSALSLTARVWDLQEIAGISGRVRFLDISAAFRADIEPRADIRFSLYANLSEPEPDGGQDIFDIGSQEIDITVVKQDETEEEFTITVEEEA